MEPIPPGEHVMGARLRALGWTRTEISHRTETVPGVTRYYSKRRGQPEALIAVTVWAPAAVDPFEHDHYALPLPA